MTLQQPQALAGNTATRPGKPTAAWLRGHGRSQNVGDTRTSRYIEPTRISGRTVAGNTHNVVTIDEDRR